MKVRPLSELLKKAEQFTKTAQTTAVSAKGSDTQISDLVKTIESAGGIEGLQTEDFEKEAMAFSRLQAVQEINYLEKIAKFEETAKKEGYTAEQIGEALEKIASDNLSKNLPLLVSLGLTGVSVTTDKNKLPTDGKAPKAKFLDLTKSLGY